MRMHELTEPKVLAITKELSELKIGNDLKNEILGNIRLKRQIGSYAGRRHQAGYVFLIILHNMPLEILRMFFFIALQIFSIAYWSMMMMLLLTSQITCSWSTNKNQCSNCQTTQPCQPTHEGRISTGYSLYIHSLDHTNENIHFCPQVTCFPPPSTTGIRQ